MHRPRLALLAVLAVSPRRRATRDRLAALLWPESTTDRARHNLADGIYQVRRALGQDALRTAADDVTLALECDATSFLADVADGRWEDAARRYAGAFLDGFHLPKAAEFDHWLEAERTRLAGCYARALEECAGSARTAGRVAEAVTWWQRRAALEPYNGRVAVALMDALANAGNRAGAIAWAERHTELLSSELGVDPDPAVTEAAAALRSARRVPETRPKLPGATTTPPAVPTRSRIRSPIALVAIAVALAVSIMARGREPDPASAPILVAPFAAVGDSTEALGALASDLTVQWLARTGVGDVGLAPDRGGSEAVSAGGLLVRGTVAREGADVLVTASVWDARRGRVVAAVGPERAPATEPWPGLAAVASRVTGTIANHLGAAGPEAPFVVATPSWPSYQAARRANALFLRRDFAEAAEGFREAYRLDTTSAGYLIWAAVAEFNLGRREQVAAIAAELRPRRHRLAPFDAAQFDWLEAALARDGAATLQAAQAARRIAPHSGVGGYQLGLELLNAGRPRAALALLDSLDPDRGWLASWDGYWHRRSTVLHLLGRHREELVAANAGYARHGTTRLKLDRVRALAALGLVAAVRALVDSTPSFPLAAAAADALHRHGHGGEARSLARGALATAGPEHADRHPQARIRLLLAAGRTREAADAADALLERQPDHVDAIGWAGVAHARLGHREAAREMHDRLARLPKAGAMGGWDTVARAIILSELGESPIRIRLLLEQSRREGWSLPYFHFTSLLDGVRGEALLSPFFELRG